MIIKKDSIKHSYLAITLGVSVLLMSTIITLIISYKISQEFIGILENQIQTERHTKNANYLFKVQIQEWKNFLIRGQSATGRQLYWQAFEDNEAKLNQEVHAIAALAPSHEIGITLENFLREHAVLGQQYRKAKQHYLTSGYNARLADQQVIGIDRLPSQLLSTLADQVALNAENNARQLELRSRNNITYSIISMVLMFILILILINRVVARAVTSEIRSKTKSDFLAKMSHEIRTPMNGVLGMAELMASTELSAVQRRYNDAIQSSGTALITIINDILDFSKIEAGKLTLEDIHYCPRQLMEDIYYLFAYTTNKKGIDLIFDVDSKVPETLRGDPSRLRQIILNLVGNAIKFTQAGYIKVQVSLSNKTKPQLLISVTDTGEGMSEQQLATVFKAFTQADSSISRRFGGTGLGLAIAREIINRMGGKIRVQSEVDHGSCFSITLPLNTVSPYQLDTSNLTNKNLLLVDDSEIFAETYSKKLCQWGMRVNCIQQPEAVVKHLQKNPNYDLICLDYQASGAEILKLAKNIRSVAAYQNTPVIVLAAPGKLPSEPALLESGISHAQEKPALAEQLVEVFIHLLEGNTLTKDRHHTDVQGNKIRSLNILAAEDNAVNGLVVRGMLKQLGHTVTIVEDGQQAVDSYLSSSQHFDIILMDCEMPNLDGYSASRQIREIETAEPQRKRIPIISLTAHAAAKQKQQCLAAGMDLVLTKPISQQRLKEAIALQTAQQ